MGTSREAIAQAPQAKFDYDVVIVGGGPAGRRA